MSFFRILKAAALVTAVLSHQPKEGNALLRDRLSRELFAPPSRSSKSPLTQRPCLKKGAGKKAFLMMNGLAITSPPKERLPVASSDAGMRFILTSKTRPSR